MYLVNIMVKDCFQEHNVLTSTRTPDLSNSRHVLDSTKCKFGGLVCLASLNDVIIRAICLRKPFNIEFQNVKPFLKFTLPNLTNKQMLSDSLNANHSTGVLFKVKRQIGLQEDHQVLQHSSDLLDRRFVQHRD